MRFLGKALVGLLAILGLIAIIVVGGTWVIVRDLSVAGPTEKPLPDTFVLQLPLEKPFPERDPALPFLGFQKRNLALRHVVDAIDAAAEDPRVVGLVGTVAESGRSMAQAQELRAAIGRFRATGKPTVAFADTLGEAGTATIDYTVAAAFDRVVLQPSGMLALTGFASEVPFARAALDSIGVEAEYGRRWEYKNAVDSLVREDMSEAHRASLTQLLGGLQDQAAAAIAADRGLDDAVVRGQLNGLPLLAGQAQSRGFVDTLGYWQETLETLGADVGTDEVIPLPRYADAIDADDGRSGQDGGDARIALIEAIGAIHRGDSDPSPFAEPSAGGDTVAKAIRAALEDDDVRAIVLRVDSPGGSYVASDTVWHEVRRARDRGIPVIASMGGVAASGGYFVAMGADHIVARPGTITGSIGVFAGKPVLQEMWSKLDITWERVAVGEHALMWSPNRPFTASEQAWFDAMLDHIYDDFTAKVATARDLSPDQLDAAARGRVFTGQQALDLGLVDALGGLDEAVTEARTRAGTPGAALVRYPEAKSKLDAIMDMMSGGDFLKAFALLTEAATLAEPVIEQTRRARIAAEGPAVMAPGF